MSSRAEWSSLKQKFNQDIYLLVGTMGALALMVFCSPPVGTAVEPVSHEVDQVDRAHVTSASHPLTPAIEMAQAALTEFRNNIKDYTALLVKRERIRGELKEYQFMDVKIRNRVVRDGRTITPLSVYLRFRKPKSVAGREVIWVEGQNGGRLLAHEGGFKNLLTVKLKPDNPLAMMGQKYPITDIGIETLILKLVEKGERDLKYGECDVQIRQGAKVSGRACTVIQVEHPQRRPYFDFYRAHIFIDDELQLPIRYAAWVWPETRGGKPILEEEYTYQNLKINVGLTDQDFDPKNSKYHFR